jgi:uncharacterized protein YdeI (YjbR/CyaY-like superfamily)
MIPPIVDLPNRAAWRAWLAANHDTSGSIRLVITKKGAPDPGVSYTDAVEEALCFGWIDSRANKLDAKRYLLLVSPRQRKSIWSRVNKERVVRLEALGLLAAPGLVKITAAKEDGSWHALDDIEALKMPANLAAALGAQPGALDNWEASGISLRKRVLYWLASARQPETISRRITRITELTEV